MGYCKSKLCKKAAEVQKEYGTKWKEVPVEILNQIGLCYQCINGVELERGAIDRD